MSAFDWDLSPPPPSDLGDHDVPLSGSHLAGKRIALLVSGGIAAFKAPLVARALRRQGADVVAFVSQEALRYVTRETLEWSTVHPVVERLTAAAEHLSDAAPFDAYLVAPATYNTLNKMRFGIADTVITAALGSALGRMEQGRTRVLVAPTMHGSLHTAILTESLAALMAMGVIVIPPREDYGKHNLPAEDVLLASVCRAVSRSPLAGQRILVTSGPTPVPIDRVRRITNVFTGKLGSLIAEELFLRGADVTLVHGVSPCPPPVYLPQRQVYTYDEYREAVHHLLDQGGVRAGVFSAAVADYRPTEVLPGKTPSGGALSHLDLVPLPKVIDEARERHPDLYMLTFKYQEGISHERLMEIGRRRLERDPAVVTNRGEETGPNGEQVAYLMTRDAEPVRFVGKPEIARGIADHLEQALELGEVGRDAGR